MKCIKLKSIVKFESIPFYIYGEAIGDHFRSGDHLRACAGQNLAMSYRNKLLSYNKKLSAPYISRTFNATIQLYRVTSPLKAFCPSENKIFAMVRNEKVQFSAQFSRPKAF